MRANLNDKHMYAAMIACSLVAAMALAPALASAVTAFIPNIKSATGSTSGGEIHAKLSDVALAIPTDGSGGAFGYGLITSAGLNGIVVTTTHQGICDSTTQSSNPTIFVDGSCSAVFHNHFVVLGADTIDTACSDLGTNLEVKDLTYQSPGKVVVKGNSATLIDIPSTFTGTSALTGNTLTINPGTSVGAAVGFTLNPVFAGGSLQHVCVENVTPHGINMNN